MRAAVLRENAEIRVEGLPRRYPDLPWREDPLSVEDYPAPEIGPGQVLLKVLACGVCYTDVDIVEGRVRCKLPVVPGHQIVGKVVEVGSERGSGIGVGDVVGVAWVGRTCGRCYYCSTSRENLCDSFTATGCHV
ncbi:MAG: alcohol dehydrogenase catalytic domain-containing protein, partial [Sulfolobales archaeon]|nr:alcohol dehydrogenase catalytic domain-containing protein [Sulfolobales archaeon]